MLSMHLVYSESCSNSVRILFFVFQINIIRIRAGIVEGIHTVRVIFKPTEFVAVDFCFGTEILNRSTCGAAVATEQSVNIVRSDRAIIVRGDRAIRQGFNVCNGSAMVYTFDYESGRPGLSPEWVSICYKILSLPMAAGLSMPSSLRDS